MSSNLLAFVCQMQDRLVEEKSVASVLRTWIEDDDDLTGDTIA